MMVNDWQLLERYARTGDESAFETLVQRYTPLVYGSALRRVGSSHADDVAQSVFIILARKAGRLRRGRARSLAGWLFRVTRFSASELIRTETRRQEREDKVEKQKLIFNQPATASAAWEHVRPVLDEALDTLRTSECDAVLLRFFQGATPAEIGATLGISENAASKRVSRGLARLRRHFERRHIVLSVQVLTLILSSKTVETVAAGWAASCAANAMGALASSETPAAALAAGTVKAMTLAKLQVAAAVALAPVAAAALGVAGAAYWPEPPQPPVATPPDTTRVAAEARTGLFPLVYKSRNTLPDGSIRYQLNHAASGKTYFVKPGDAIMGYTVIEHVLREEERFVPGLNRTNRIDCSELVLEQDGRRIVLVRGQVRRVAEEDLP